MAALEMPDCLACHPVHTPLNISYPATQAKEVCAGCHDQAYQLLQEHQTKHSALTCAKCHPAHDQLPARIVMESPTVL
jgi:predicted CXXCH cytochrome family protein